MDTKQRQTAFAGWLPEPDADAITSDDWYTPPELVDEIADWFGGTIDLDPCWSPRSFVKPRIGYTERDNGLVRPWHGGISAVDQSSTDEWLHVGTELVDVRNRFLNPPYSHPGPWLRMLAQLHASVRPELAGDSVMLIRIDTSTWWWAYAWEADAICWLHARVPFVRPGSTARSQPRDHHALLYWGTHDVAFRESWSWLGHVQLRRDELIAGLVDQLADRNVEAVRPALIRDHATSDRLGLKPTPLDDVPAKREHERSRSHELVAIDHVPIETFPFLPTRAATLPCCKTPAIRANVLLDGVGAVDLCTQCGAYTVIESACEKHERSGCTDCANADTAVITRDDVENEP